jgi:hypothetical protein
VDFTSNGILGLGKLRSCRPDILLVELKLCGLSGLELIKAARAEPTFGNRPIYVFTHAERMSRTTRKELKQLATTVFDKSTTTREDLVKSFATTFSNSQPVAKKPSSNVAPGLSPAQVNQMITTKAIEEIVAGVREQSELLASGTADRGSNGDELHSRVSSLASCAEAASLSNLSRLAKALENFLKQLRAKNQEYTDEALRTITRAVEVMTRMSFGAPDEELSPTRFTAVLVDEAPRSNRVMKEALVDAGFEPVCFEEPTRARQYLASNPTELIIANVMLPEAHSLTLADIRKLPLHAETPVIFGPESPFIASTGEALPTNAPRVDLDPLLSAELVVRALNEVHNPQPTEQPSPASTASRASPQPFANINADASSSFEDGFELFGQSQQPFRWSAAEAPENNAVEESLVESTAESEPSADHLFSAADIPTEPFFKAEPSTPGAGQEAEILTRLAATPIDGSQVDEPALEALPLSGFHTEASQQPQPELTPEDQALTAWLVEAEGEVGQSVPTTNTASELQQNEFAGVQDMATATPKFEEVMNDQFQAALQEHLADHRSQAEGRLAAETPAEETVAEQDAQMRCAELEQELASLRQAMEDFSGSFDQQQNAAAAADKRVQDLEQRLSQSAADLEKHQVEQIEAQAQLRQEVETANAAHQQSEVARQEAQARCAQLELELDRLRQERAELASQLAQEQKVSAESSTRLKQLEAQAATGEPGSSAEIRELEQQVRQGVAALARATADLAREKGERQRSQQRTTELNSRLQELHEDFSRTLQAQRENLERIGALEEEQRQTRQDLDRRTADLEQLQAEYRLNEEELQKANESNAQLRKDLSFFEEANKKFGGSRQELQDRLEANLNAARENDSRLQQEVAERQRLGDALETAQREVQNQARRYEALEQELKAARETLQQREAKLQKEATERQRLNEAQNSARRNLWDGSERDLELSKLQSSLELGQVERKRLETELARARQSALDAGHAARSLRTALRRQIREPFDNLVHSTRSLLELELGDEQKKLAEAALQDVLLVQTRLREPDLPHGDPAEPAAPPT